MNKYCEIGGNYVPQDWDDEEADDKTWGQEDEEDLHHVDCGLAEQSAEYWHILKLVKYLKVGDETCTLLALIGLKDCPLAEDVPQLALKLSGGTEVLLNILRTSSLKCIVGSLQVLENSTKHPAAKAAVFHLGGLQAVEQLVQHREVQVRGLAASVIARVCKMAAARDFVIKSGGLRALVDLVRLDPRSSTGMGGGVTAAGGVVSAQEMVMAAVEAAGRALWAITVSPQGRGELLRADLLETLPLLLLYQSAPLQQAVIGILHQCLIEGEYRSLVEGMGLTSSLIAFLQQPSAQLRCLASQALARASKLESTRSRIVKEGGLDILMRILNVEVEPFIQLKINPRKFSRRGSAVPSGVSEAPAAVRKGSGAEEGPKFGNSNLNIEMGQQKSSRSPSVVGLTVPVGDRASFSSGTNLMVPNAGIAEPGTVEPSEDAASMVLILPENDEEARRMEAILTEEAGGEVKESELLEAVTAILWHVACTPSHVEPLHALESVTVFTALLDHSNEKVVSQVAGALAEVAALPKCCSIVVSSGGIPKLVSLLRRTAPHLLLNVTRALRSCASNKEALALLLEQDGLRLLWSHLKSNDHRIQASAASAICTCLHQEESGLAEEVRSLGGGIELLVALLESPSEAVLSAACAAIARIAVNPRNLAIMTDYGAVTCLSRLAVRENNTLRPFLAEAIAACCISRDTGLLFGRAGAVAPLVQYLETSDSQVRRPTCRALHRLSLEPENCVTLHQSGAVPLLLEMLSSPDEVVQEAAADCLRNIRLLALRRCRGRGVVPMWGEEK